MNRPVLHKEENNTTPVYCAGKQTYKREDFSMLDL